MLQVSGDLHWDYFNPVKVVSSPLNTLNTYVEATNVILVTTAGFVSRGVVQDVCDILHGTLVHVWSGVTPNPDIQEIESITRRYIHSGIDFVIGLGGGSAIDAAKALSLTLADSDSSSLTDLFRLDKKQIWKKRLPLLVVPTTSGTGSEVTPFATIWDREKKKKYSISTDFSFPDVALLDPSLTLTLGPSETLYPGLDTISHALESLWNKNKNPISQIYALEALNLANEALPIVMEEPTSQVARRKMQMASTFAGFAISQTRTALAHSISYPLTAHFGVPHGLACSFTLCKLIDVYLSQETKLSYEKLVRDTQILLSSLRLDLLIKDFASQEEILSLSGEMYTPGRADNFSVKLPDLADILVS